MNSPKPCAEGPGYVALQVGRALAPERFSFIADDTGDHISGFNPSFCELTGLRWIWKNNNLHVVGLMHYRRYFAPVRQYGLAFGDHHVAQAIGLDGAQASGTGPISESATLTCSAASRRVDPRTRRRLLDAGFLASA